VELYAGNERAHRHVKLPGLEGDVIALPSEGRQGGDLYALFSCGDQRYARMVLADAVGHGFSASVIAADLHELLHRFEDLSLDHRTHELRRGDRTVALTRTEYALMEVL
jgi:serine phosphatase RsbU (regulator of sigma subunit)